MIEVGIFIIILAIKFRPALSGLSYEGLDRFLERHEQRHGRLVWTVQLSLLLTVFVSLYARLDTDCSVQGCLYMQLAENPFAIDPDNSIQYRILAPLISYCLGLHGSLLIITNLLFTAGMIGCVYACFRTWFERAGDALLATVTISFSLVVLTSLHCGGYTDILTYLLVFLMWWFRDRRVLHYLFFLLALLNHESVIFLVPWLVYVSLQMDRSKSRKAKDLLLGFGLSIGLYCLFRLWVSSHIDVKFDLDYYLTPLFQKPIGMFRRTIYYHLLGLITVFQVTWLFPIAAAVSFKRAGKRTELISMGLLMVCVYAQMMVAYDTSRMLTLGFLIMIISLKRLLETDEFNFRRRAFWIVLFGLMIPQFYTALDIIEIWQSWATSKIF